MCSLETRLVFFLDGYCLSDCIKIKNKSRILFLYLIKCLLHLLKNILKKEQWILRAHKIIFHNFFFFKLMYLALIFKLLVYVKSENRKNSFNI